MTTKDPFNFLYTKRAEIYKKITEISKKDDVNERLADFDQPFNYIRKHVLQKMGSILYSFIILYLKSNDRAFDPYNFKFYFWPGYTTLSGKRILIWGDKIDDRTDQKNYYTGIGYDNGVKFKNCPTSLAYDHVLNVKIFEGTDL